MSKLDNSKKPAYATETVNAEYGVEPSEWNLLYLPGVGMGKGYPVGKPVSDSVKSQIRPMRLL